MSHPIGSSGAKCCQEVVRRPLPLIPSVFVDKEDEATIPEKTQLRTLNHLTLPVGKINLSVL